MKPEEIFSNTAHVLARLGVKNTSDILAAVSGGVDSMCMLFILDKLRRQGQFKKLGVIHINHSLRGWESDKDELLVKETSKKLKVPVFPFSVDTKELAISQRIGIDETARLARYEKIAE